MQFSTTLEVIEYALDELKYPATAKEIAGEIRKRPELAAWVRGRTPEKTVQARISVDILERGERSAFFRYSPAVYGLRKKLENGEYPETFRREYLFWRRRRRELAHTYIAAINPDGSTFSTRRGFLPKEYFPLSILRHLNIWLIDRRQQSSEIVKEFKWLRYYYCFRSGDFVVRYRRSQYDVRHEGRVGNLSIGFDGWVTEKHISMFSPIGFDISSSVYSDAITIFGHSSNLSMNVEFLGFVSDEADRRNRDIISVAFVAVMNERPNFDEMKGMRDLEWIHLGAGSNLNSELENWSKYLMQAL